MRLTFLTHFPGRGGSTSFLRQLRDFFDAQGHETSVVCGADDSQPQLTDYRVVPTRSRRRDRRLAYLETIVATRPDVVYAISGTEEFDVTRFVAVPRVRHIFSVERHDRADIPRLVRHTREFTELFTANTPDVLADLQRWTGRPDTTVALAPYRLSPLWHSSPQPSSDPRPGPVRICFSGRLDREQKRAHWLPEIIRGLDAAGIDYRFEIAGDGPESTALAEAFHDHPRVTLHGWLSPQALHALYRRCHLFFLCSRWEGLPIAMAEAMTCGVACVVPDQPGGMAATVHLADAGWAYPARHPRNAVQALLEALTAADFRLQAQIRATKWARHFFDQARVENAWMNLADALQKLETPHHVLRPEITPRLRSVSLRRAVLRSVLRTL